MTNAIISNHSSDLRPQLEYTQYAGYVNNPSYWVQNGILQVNRNQLVVRSASHRTSQKLPVLCTQTQPGNQWGGYSPINNTALVTVQSGDIYEGYRNKKAFWFTGVRYAAFPGRWNYSSVYQGNGSVVNATAIGSECLQYGSGSEDCLFLNIETPYIPKEGSSKNLRPVLFWIHGGGYTGRYYRHTALTLD